MFEVSSSVVVVVAAKDLVEQVQGLELELELERGLGLGLGVGLGRKALELVHHHSEPSDCGTWPWRSAGAAWHELPPPSRCSSLMAPALALAPGLAIALAPGQTPGPVPAPATAPSPAPEPDPGPLPCVWHLPPSSFIIVRCGLAIPEELRTWLIGYR